jgi:hypothetical protein
MVLARDIMSAWEGINNGVVDQNAKTREKYWLDWTAYTAAFNKDPYMHSLPENQQLLLITAFAARVRTGHFGLGNTVRVQSVRNALSAISKTFQLVGLPSPVLQAQGAYKIPVGRLVEGYKRLDPPSVPQLAVPIKVPKEVHRAGYSTESPRLRAIGDLTILAFYYLLRVGEYTKPRFVQTETGTKRATRTVQFRVADIGFFKRNKILRRNSPLAELLEADACTLKITNQKNGRMGETIHHVATGDESCCPVKAAARRVNHILSKGGSTSNIICDVCHNAKTQEWYQVTPTDIRTQVRSAVHKLQLRNSGIDPDLVGSHSLRAGGAMALKLTGSDDTTIMKVGRWTSLTFLQYIHNQISHLSADLSSDMSTELQYTNIAAIEPA